MSMKLVGYIIFLYLKTKNNGQVKSSLHISFFFLFGFYETTVYKYIWFSTRKKKYI